MLKRTPLSRGTKSLSKKALRNRTPEAITRQKKEKALLQEEDIAFYQKIWDERLHKDDLTGLWLGLEPLKSMFHHLLPKAVFPEFRHSKWNILLTTPQWHSQIETNPGLLPESLYLTYMNKLLHAQEIGEI